MESKQCTKCKRTLLFEEFKMNKRTGQVTKQCIKCIDIVKKSIEKHKYARFFLLTSLHSHELTNPTLKYEEDGISPTIEEVAKRLHYTNTQPLWATENMSKGNRYTS